MFSFHKPKIYRSVNGCCICRAKSSSSRFTDSRKYEPEFERCFRIAERRSGEICNACVLLVKRWKKLPPGTTRDWHHVVDARAGPGTKGHLSKVTGPKGGSGNGTSGSGGASVNSKRLIGSQRRTFMRLPPRRIDEFADYFDGMPDEDSLDADIDVRLDDSGSDISAGRGESDDSRTASPVSSDVDDVMMMDDEEEDDEDEEDCLMMDDCCDADDDSADDSDWGPPSGNTSSAAANAATKSAAAAVVASSNRPRRHRRCVSASVKKDSGRQGGGVGGGTEEGRRHGKCITARHKESSVADKSKRSHHPRGERSSLRRRSHDDSRKQLLASAMKISSFLDMTFWRKERVCCGIIFKGPQSQVLIYPKLLRPCQHRRDRLLSAAGSSGSQDSLTTPSPASSSGGGDVISISVSPAASILKSHSSVAKIEEDDRGEEEEELLMQDATTSSGSPRSDVTSA